MVKQAGFAFALIAVAGCASMPNVELKYFPARATTDVSVTQTIECVKSALHFSYSPSVTTTYAADRAAPKPLPSLHTGKLDGTFSDTELTFGWFDDGRLKSVNQSTTGQGEAIVKAALTLAAALGGGALRETTETRTDVCDAIATLGGGKPIVLTYITRVEYEDAKLGRDFPLVADKNSTATWERVKQALPALPPLKFSVLAFKAIEPVATDAGNEGTIALTLNRTAIAPAEILVGDVKYWDAEIVVPTSDTYTLPIPAPKAFGKETFSLVLNDAGAVTSIGYTKGTGAAGALNAATATATATAFAPTNDAAKADALKAQADLIAQTQRLAACQAKPAECQ
jgi:hypothetical protein